MKKLVSVLLVLVMALAAMPVMAESVAEEVLLKVKEKIDVPEELTEFDYSENKYDDVLRYDFWWRTENYDKELYVSSDSKGRIVNYSYYEQADYSEGRSLIEYTLSDAQPLALKTMAKMFPEYMADKASDYLVLDEGNIKSSYSGRYKTFTFTFERTEAGRRFESNYVIVRVRATKDRIYVQSVSASLDEDASIISEEVYSEIRSREEKYEAHFPIELYYAKDYSTDEPEVKLFYRMNKGYVAEYSDRVLTEVRFDRYAGFTEDAMEESTVTMGSANKNEAMLTPEEQGEIDKMTSLVKAEVVEKKLRSMPVLNIGEDMVLKESYTYKSDDKYFVNFTLSSDKRNMYVVYNGETGEIMRINSYMRYYDDSKKKSVSDVIPEIDIKNFAKELSGDKLDETKIDFSSGKESCSMNAERLVNSVRYPENGIHVTYDTLNNMVTSYSIAWDEDVSKFPKPENAIGIDEAREKIFEVTKIEKVYLNIGEGYAAAFTIEKGVTLDALTGEEMFAESEGKQKYSDIKGHWAEEMINVLWEHDIYLDGGKFMPDEPVTQADMLRLFSACRDNGVIPIGWTKESVAEYGFNNGYVETNEPDKSMTRAEGFDALVEIIGYGEVAGFDIYKSSYADMEADGSAEILKAMGVLTGNEARPGDYLTRAEAAVMVYRYLSR